MKIARETMASGIIILIAGMAFAAGFLQEGVSSDVEELKNQVSEMKLVLDRMDTKIREVIELDQSRVGVAGQEYQKASMYMLEYEITNGTLSVEEEDVLVNRIGRALTIFNLNNNFTEVVKMYNHWYTEGNSSNYFFATELDDGYDLSYTKEDFDSFNASYVPSMLVFCSDEAFIGGSPIGDYLIAIGVCPEGYTRVNAHVALPVFLKRPLYEIQEQIKDNETLIANLESKASFYSYGVSLITVSTILAAAMATQLNDKEQEKNFSIIKAKIFDDKSMIVTKKNKIAMPFLFVALIISALGLLLPILFRLIF